MKQAWGLVALGGLSTGAVGQLLSVHLSFDATDAAMGEIVTATLIAEFDGFIAGSYLCSVNIDLLASTSDVYEVIDVAPVAWNNPALGFEGQGIASGSDVVGIDASQFSLIPPIDGSNPIQIATFTLRRIGTGSIEYAAEESGTFGTPFAFSMCAPGGFDQPPIGYGADVFTSDTLLGTPSPGVLGVLGVGGVLAGRRRRVG
jgi:MYXO-CTERM domain-containing protein